MYMCICEHAYVWGKQKGEGGKTPGCRNFARQAACLEALSDRPSVASFPAIEVVPPAPMLWPMSARPAYAPTSLTHARCAVRHWAARSLAGHICSESTASREPKQSRLACTQSPTAPASLRVASACAQAGTQAQEKTRRLGGLHCSLCRCNSPAVVPRLRVGAHADLLNARGPLMRLAVEGRERPSRANWCDRRAALRQCHM